MLKVSKYFILFKNKNECITGTGTYFANIYGYLETVMDLQRISSAPPPNFPSFPPRLGTCTEQLPVTK
jgi:hypothetical protein